MKKSNLDSVRWITVMLFLIMVSACQPGSLDTSVPDIEDNQLATIVAATLTAIPSQTSEPTQTPTSTPIPTETPISSLTYVNQTYGLTFEYPPSWAISETFLPKGERLFSRSFNRFDAGSDKYDELIIEIRKEPDWLMEITVRNAAPSCGGYASDFLGVFGKEAPTIENYKPLVVLGQEVYRLRPEDGFAYFVGEREPYPVLIVVPNISGKCTDYDADAFLFNIADTDNNLLIDIVYYSSQFTEENLQNRTIDFDTLLEMDKIIESLQVLPSNE